MERETDADAAFLSSNVKRQKQEEHYCWVCARPAIGRCKQCAMYWYCSRECQLKHWTWPRDGHRHSCGKNTSNDAYAAAEKAFLATATPDEATCLRYTAAARAMNEERARVCSVALDEMEALLRTRANDPEAVKVVVRVHALLDELKARVDAYERWVVDHPDALSIEKRTSLHSMMTFSQMTQRQIEYWMQSPEYLRLFPAEELSPYSDTALARHPGADVVLHNLLHRFAQGLWSIDTILADNNETSDIDPTVSSETQASEINSDSDSAEQEGEQDAGGGQGQDQGTDGVSDVDPRPMAATPLASYANRGLVSQDSRPMLGSGRGNGSRRRSSSGRSSVRETPVPTFEEIENAIWSEICSLDQGEIISLANDGVVATFLFEMGVNLSSVVIGAGSYYDMLLFKASMHMFRLSIESTVLQFDESKKEYKKLFTTQRLRRKRDDNESYNDRIIRITGNIGVLFGTFPIHTHIYSTLNALSSTFANFAAAALLFTGQVPSDMKWMLFPRRSFMYWAIGTTDINVLTNNVPADVRGLVRDIVELSDRLVQNTQTGADNLQVEAFSQLYQLRLTDLRKRLVPMLGTSGIGSDDIVDPQLTRIIKVLDTRMSEENLSSQAAAAFLGATASSSRVTNEEVAIYDAFGLPVSVDASETYARRLIAYLACLVNADMWTDLQLTSTVVAGFTGPLASTLGFQALAEASFQYFKYSAWSSVAVMTVSSFVGLQVPYTGLFYPMNDGASFSWFRRFLYYTPMTVPAAVQSLLFEIGNSLGRIREDSLLGRQRWFRAIRTRRIQSLVYNGLKRVGVGNLMIAATVANMVVFYLNGELAVDKEHVIRQIVNIMMRFLAATNTQAFAGYRLLRQVEMATVPVTEKESIVDMIMDFAPIWSPYVFGGPVVKVISSTLSYLFGGANAQTRASIQKTFSLPLIRAIVVGAMFLYMLRQFSAFTEVKLVLSKYTPYAVPNPYGSYVRGAAFAARSVDIGTTRHAASSSSRATATAAGATFVTTNPY